MMRNRSSDIHQDLEISLKQAGEGLTTTITVDAVESNFSLQVKVPPGVDTGSRLRIGGKGKAEIGNQPGDLYVVIHVSAHELFERKGADLHTKVGVSSEKLERGYEISVETLLDGPKYLQIPANTKAGTIFRIQGLGMPRLGKDRGDLYV